RFGMLRITEVQRENPCIPNSHGGQLGVAEQSAIRRDGIRCNKNRGAREQPLWLAGPIGACPPHSITSFIPSGKDQMLAVGCPGWGKIAGRGKRQAVLPTASQIMDPKVSPFRSEHFDCQAGPVWREARTVVSGRRQDWLYGAGLVQP